MRLYPTGKVASQLTKVYERFSKVDFPALREQLDKNFLARYKEFWEKETRESLQAGFWDVLGEPVVPFEHRLAMDMEVCGILGMRVTPADLVAHYGTIVKEMIITRHLTRD